jgi:hypothetical protein
MKPLRYFSLILTLCGIASLSGCTHLQLQANTTRQAKTVSTIYEEQVLDNLAMFVCDPYATPYFSVPGQGTNAVNDSGGFTAGAGFAARFWKNFALTGTRAYQQNWVLNPVVAPNRLLLMQCAYQRAVGLSFDECSKCCDAERDWAGTKGTQRIKVIDPSTGELILDPKTNQPYVDKATGMQFVDCPVAYKKLPSVSKPCSTLVPEPAGGTLSNDEGFVYQPTIMNDPRSNKPYDFDPAHGEIIIPKQDCDDPCGITCGWVQHSNCWKDVPSCCCQRYGYHCGTYVWVDPSHSREFSKLVLKIVDYASGNQAAADTPATKQVQFYFNADGSFGDVKHHARSITATVSGNKSIEQIERDLNITVTSEEMADDQLDLKSFKAVNENNRGQIESYMLNMKEKYPSFGIADESKLRALSADELDKHRRDLESKLEKEANNLKRRRIEAIRRSSVSDETPRRDFGQPTQFNSSFGGSLLDMQQRLNAVTPR